LEEVDGVLVVAAAGFTAAAAAAGFVWASKVLL
jgi:hypothetical protein